MHTLLLQLGVLVLEICDAFLGLLDRLLPRFFFGMDRAEVANQCFNLGVGLVHFVAEIRKVREQALGTLQCTQGVNC